MSSRNLEIQTAEVFEPLLEPARYKGAHGGRGSGKSHHFAGSLVERHLLIPGCRSVCIREVQKSLEQSSKKLIQDKIAKFGVEDYFDIKKYEIESYNGGIIVFQGMQNHTAESIKSLEAFDTAWVEEAQSLSQRSLDLLRPTIRKEGSEIWFSWNPRYETDPIDVFWRGGELPPNSILVEALYHHNPWFPDVLRQEMEWDRKRDPDKFAHTWEGKYERRSEARVFKNFKIEEFETPSDARFYFGADWGFSQDPTVLIRMFIEGRTIFIDAEAYQIGCRIEDIPKLFAQIEHSKRWPIVGDSSRPDTIDFVRRHGYPRLEGAKKGKDSIYEGVEFLQSFDIVIHPRCKRVIEEFLWYSYEVDKLTDEVLPKLADEHNHFIDSARYALEKLRRSTYDLEGIVNG